MSHGHHHHHHHGEDSDSRSLLIAFFLNSGFTVFEIIGGLLTNSVAILSDALHDLGDSLSLGLAWVLQRLSGRAGDQRFTYGYRRLSLLAALINALVLIIGSVIVLSEVIPRLMNPESFDAPGMIAIALVGVAVNGLAAWRLRGTGSANAQVVGWHLLEDVLGWVAVLIVGVVSLFIDLPILDPLLSLGITAYILINVFGRLWHAVRLFLQAAPQNVDVATIQDRLCAIDGVQAVHHLHLWSLDGEHNVFSAHLVISPQADKHAALDLKQRSKDLLNGMDLNLEHITIEVEYGEGDCSMQKAGEAAC